MQKKAKLSVRLKSAFYYAKFRLFSRHKKLDIADVEEKFLRNVATKDKSDALVALRFEVWMRTKKIKATPIEKTKLKSAFRAGFESHDWRIND